MTEIGRPVELSPTEYDLMVEMSTSAVRVVLYDQLPQRVWSSDRLGGVRSLRTHLMRLRRKLGENAESHTYILAEPRVGYRMLKGKGRKSQGLTSATMRPV